MGKAQRQWTSVSETRFMCEAVYVAFLWFDIGCCIPVTLVLSFIRLISSSLFAEKSLERNYKVFQCPFAVCFLCFLCILVHLKVKNNIFHFLGNGTFDHL